MVQIFRHVQFGIPNDKTNKQMGGYYINPLAEISYSWTSFIMSLEL